MKLDEIFANNNIKIKVAEDENYSYDDLSDYEYSIKDIVYAINDNNLILAHDAWTAVTNQDSITNILDVLINNVTFQKLQPFLEQHKKEIVKDLLWDVKDGIIDDAESKLNALAEVDIEWPELATIKRSLQADKQLSEEDSGQEDFIKASIPRLFQQNNPGAALNIINAHYKADPNNIKWLRKHIAPILRKHKNKLRDWVAKSVDAVTMPRIVSARNLLKQLGVELPDIKNIINDNKDHVIKRYLQVIQNHKSVEPVIKDIQHLRELGITWPELDIIAKSYSIDKSTESLNEITQEEREDILYNDWYDFVHALKDNESYTCIVNLEKYLKYGGSKDKARTQVQAHADWFKKVLDRTVEYLNFDFFEKTVSALKMLGFDWPEMNIEHHKDTIIKEFLSRLRRGNNPGLDKIQALRKLGYNWPELGVIEHSIRAEFNKIKENSLNQNTNRMLEDAIMYLSNGEISIAIYWFLKCIQNGDNIRIARDEIEKHRKNLVSYLEQRLRSVEIRHLVEVGHILTAVGLTWPEVENMIERNKEAIIKSLLSYYKRTNPASAITKINSLKRVGVDWPELDIILRSANAGLTNK